MQYWMVSIIELACGQNTLKQIYFSIPIKLVSKVMDVNEHERLSNITLKTQIKVKKQLVVRKNMDVN